VDRNRLEENPRRPPLPRVLRVKMRAVRTYTRTDVMTRSLAGLVLATVVCGACTDASPSETTTVVDSASVRIVTNLPASIEAVEVWSLSTEPVVEIGAGATPDVPLYQVTDVTPLDADRVAVGTNTPPQTLIFGAHGTLAATLGREGEGPGEFATVTSVVPLDGDSVAVWDQNRRRISVFTGDGRYVREVDLSGLALLTPLAAASMDGLTAWTHLLPSAPGSFVLFQVGLTGDPGPGVIRVEAPSYRITAAGAEQARLGPFPGQELYHFGAGQGGMYPYPLGAATYGATVGGAFVVGTADAPEYRVFGVTGAPERIVRWPDHDRTVGGPLLAEWTEVRATWFASMSAGQREFLDRMPQPERFPAYDGIIAGDGGRVWVGEYVGPLEIPYPPLHVRVPERSWLVFDAAGALTATVRTPMGFQPHAVRDERIWGVFTDELDVESIRAYEVVKR